MNKAITMVMALVACLGAAAADAQAPATPTGQSIDPGMTRAEVEATLGTPVAARSVGSRSYLFFKNGRERSAGFYDLVLLENDAVVDAIFRAPGRRYTGTSSSPAGVKPAPTNVVSVPADAASAPGSAVGPARPGGSAVLPSIVGSPGGGRSAGSVPAGAVSQPAEKVSAPVDSGPKRFIGPNDAMPPNQPARTVFPTQTKTPKH
jgi:hypothetical protein